MAMPLEELRKLVSDGHIFGARFIKRTDGKIRTMSCRTGVQPKQISSQPRQWDPTEKGLLQVWDMHKKGYRMIPADSLLQLSVRGRKITL
jgi:hypothetical protein